MSMFDDSIWNNPFGGEGVVHDAPEVCEEMLSLLNENILPEGMALKQIKADYDYEIKTNKKMTKIYEAAQQACSQNGELAVAPLPGRGSATELQVRLDPPKIVGKRVREVEHPVATCIKAVKAKKSSKTQNMIKATSPDLAQDIVVAPPLPLITSVIRLSTRYVDIYQNVMNSGSFVSMQKFLYQHMSRPCQLQVDTSDTRVAFRLPKLINAEGPALMAHYFLGCLVMYPDMLMYLKGSTTMTVNGIRKIVMRLETMATKSVDLPLAEWLPLMSSLENTYQRFLERPVTTSQANEDRVQQSLEAMAPQTEMGGHSCAGNEKSSVNSNVSCHTTSISLGSLYMDIPLIPESYVKYLYGKASLLPTPKPIMMRGTVTLQLDANDYIFDISSHLVQINA